MNVATVNVDPAQFLSGWRDGLGVVFLPALSECRVGDHVSVRVGLLGRSIRSTLFGRISMVRRYGRPSIPPGVDLEIDPTSLPSARFLAAVARGETVNYRERAPRFVVDRSLTVNIAGASHDVRTATVSEGGCGLRWTAREVPRSGDLIDIQLGTGFFAPTASGVVCWNGEGGAEERMVGVRIVPEGRGGRGWKALVGEAARTGARMA